MGKISSGSIPMPSTYTKNNNAPLDDRDLVSNKIDLITSSIWTVGSDDTRYEGMIVYVVNESKLYCLIDAANKNTSDYSGWKDITAEATGVTSVGLSMPDIFNVSGSPVTSSGTLTASFVNQNDKTIFGRNSGSSGVPSFIDATNLWTIENIGDNTTSTGLLKKTAQNAWSLTSSYSDVGLYSKKLQHKLNSSTATDVGDIIRDTNLDLSLPEFYAPTTVGNQYNLLMSNGSGAPSWILPTLASGKTSGLLKYVVGSGWTFDSNTYLTSVSFSDLTSTPTTLAEYGITDANISNGTITLGNDTITPLTSEQYTGTVTNITAGVGLNTTSDDTTTDGGSITNTGTLYLTKSGVTAGTYQGITVDKYGRVTAASDQGYTTNTGTVTSVQVQATSPVLSSTSTASTTTLDTTISLDSAYGDTQNPYGSKTANYVLAGPASGNAALPSFRALVAADIPSLTVSKISDFPTLATVATSGDYNDLTNTPSIPAAQIQSDWNQSDNTAVDYIKNKPTIPTIVDEKVKQYYTSNVDDDFGLLFTYNPNPQQVQNPTTSVRYSDVTVNPYAGLIKLTSSFYKLTIGASSTTPILYQIRPSPIASWVDVQNRIITSNGLIIAPTTTDTYLKWNGSAFIWATIASSTDTTYKIKLNGTYEGDAISGTDLLTLSGSIYAPTTAGSSSNLFLKWDVITNKPIWTTLSSILGGTSSDLLLGDGTTLTKATTTTKINGTLYTALSDTGSAQTQTDSIYAPESAGTSGYIVKSNGSGAPTWDTIYNIIGKQSSNYVLVGNGTGANDNIVSWQQLSLSSLSDTPNTGTLTLNGTGFSVYTPTASLSKTWYAPTSAGTQYDLLQADSNGIPTWLTPSTTGLLKFTSNSGWSIDTNDYFIKTNTYFYAEDNNSQSQSWGSLTNNNTISFAKGDGIEYGIGNNVLTIRQKAATSTTLGGVKVSTTTAGTISSVASSGNYYPVQLDNTSHACVRIPSSGGISYSLAYTGYDGLLRVIRDATPTKEYINDVQVEAVPIFYSDGKDATIIYVYDDKQEDYVCYSDDRHFEGHYVNLYDIVNGIIRNQELVKLLADAIKEQL